MDWLTGLCLMHAKIEIIMNVLQSPLDTRSQISSGVVGEFYQGKAILTSIFTEGCRSYQGRYSRQSVGLDLHFVTLIPG